MALWRQADLSAARLGLKQRDAPMICPSCQSVAIAVVDLDPKSPANYAHPVPHEGRIAIVTDAGWDAVDADALLTNGADADGEVVWS